MAHVSSTAVKLSKMYNDPALQSAAVVADAARGRFILFSDLHRGQGDGADDYVLCEDAYVAALKRYADDGYTLIHLGDVEELWEVPERSWKRIFEVHARSYDVERALHAEGRYHRVFGNHDLPWTDAATVAKHLHPVFPGIAVHEVLTLPVVEDGVAQGRLYLFHGHQGELFSDELRSLARFFVFSLWASIQNVLAIRSTHYTPMFDLENDRDRSIYFDWAVTHGNFIAVSGHTHRPVCEQWDGVAHPQRIARHIAKLERRLRVARGDAQLASQIRVHLNLWKDRFARALVDDRAPQRFQPAFLNTGCCCFDEPIVSGIEIADGEIRLVRWIHAAGETTREVLRTMPLLSSLAATGRSVGPGFWTSRRLNVVIAD
jgi:predicted phosphodiesterase